MTAKDILHSLATTYRIDNVMCKPTDEAELEGSKIDDSDDISVEVLPHRQQTEKQKKAIEYCKEKVGKGKRNKFHKFDSDERLDGIRKDVSLCHTALSLGTYKSGGKDVSSSTNTRSSTKKKKSVGGSSSSVKKKGVGSKDDASTTRKKKRKRDSSIDAGEDSGSEDTTTPKTTRNLPRCILCTALESNSNNASRSIWYCQTCHVHLCITVKGKKRTTCFDRFHKARELKSLLKDATVAPKKPIKQATRSSPRKSQVRKSPRKRKQRSIALTQAEV